MEKISIIIPAYNEEKSISEIIQEIKALNKDFEIIVVNDASTDNTGKIAKESGAKVINMPYNMGNGAAIKNGVKNAAGDVLVLMDADGQHSPNDIPKLLEHIEHYDMVVGARTSKSDVSRFRTFGNWTLNLLANYLSGMRILDLTSGFRAIKKERISEVLHILPNKYSYPTTITLSMLKSGYSVKYVPLESIKRRKKGKSHIKPFKDGLNFIMIMLRTIMLFDPLKVFLPTSVILIIGGICSACYSIIAMGGIQENAVIFLIAGITVFLFGLLADQNAHIRREMGRKD